MPLSRHAFSPQYFFKLPLRSSGVTWNLLVHMPYPLSSCAAEHMLCDPQPFDMSRIQRTSKDAGSVIWRSLCPYSLRYTQTKLCQPCRLPKLVPRFSHGFHFLSSYSLDSESFASSESLAGWPHVILCARVMFAQNIGRRNPRTIPHERSITIQKWGWCVFSSALS